MRSLLSWISYFGSYNRELLYQSGVEVQGVRRGTVTGETMRAKHAGKPFCIVIRGLRRRSYKAGVETWKSPPIRFLLIFLT